MTDDFEDNDIIVVLEVTSKSSGNEQVLMSRSTAAKIANSLNARYE